MVYSTDFLMMKELSVVRLSWQGGFFAVKPRNQCALIYRVSGNAMFTVDGRKIVSNQGDVFFMPQGKEYTADYTDGEIIAFHFTLVGDIGDAKNYTVQNGEELYKLFTQAQIAYNSKCAGFNYRTVSLFYEVLANIYDSKEVGILPSAISDAISYIRTNFKDNTLCVPDICHRCGMGETAFRRSFKRNLNRTPIEYITELRLENAKDLILSGESIERAAIQSGFCDPKYFSRLVKKRFGCTPRQLNEYGR